MKKTIHILTGIMIMMSSNFTHLYAQGGATGNQPGGGSNVLGWDGTVGAGAQDITLENQFASKNITFNTNNTGTNGASTTQMTILGNSGTTTGYVGIGNTFTPTFKLDVDQGDINLNTGVGYSYRIGQLPFLWNNGNTTNLFCGVNAGNGGAMGDNNTFMGVGAGTTNAGTGLTSGALNTFIGSLAGNQNTIGRGNTFIGRRAGENNTEGKWNTFTGVLAGNTNTEGEWNCFYGKEAGFANTLGDGNTFLGAHAGEVNTEGYYNVMLGFNCGLNNDLGVGNSFVGVGSGGYTTDGFHNVALGFEAGQGNETGDVNIAIGYRSQGFSVPTDLNYTIALGASASVEADYSVAIGANAIAPVTKTMILGDNDISVGIGLSTDPTGPLAKLHVFRENVGDVSNSTAVYVENEEQSEDTYFSYGIKNITHCNNEFNYGITSDVYNGNNNYGVYSTAIQTANEVNVGGFFHADYGHDNFGVIGYAPLSVDAAFNVGVYGEAPTNGSTPPWTTAGVGSYAGYFNGDLAYTDFFGTFSDSTIKTNIQLFNNASSILNQINCYTYIYDSTKVGKHIHLSKEMQYGVLAQEVEQVAPGLVKNGKLAPELDSLGHIISPAQPVKIVDYVKMVPLLLEGYHELHAQIAELQAIIQSCCGANRSNGSTGQNENSSQRTLGAIDVTLSSRTIVLNQNSPNPFKEQTTITYIIPEDAKNVKIIFTDSRSNVLKEVAITQTGNGQMNVYAQDLSSGIYTYSLVINGVTIDTKKMICSK